MNTIKHFSRKTLHAKSRVEATYYANHTARRYAARYTNWKLRNKATWKHEMVQCRELRALREQGATIIIPASNITWASMAARHKDQHNPHHQAVMAASRQRQAEHDQRHDADVSAAAAVEANRLLSNLFTLQPLETF